MEHLKSLYFLLTFSFFVISCQAQEHRNAAESKDLKSGTTWVDPLFYIEGQLAAWIRNIYQDRSGNLWLATNHYGIMRYANDTLEYFDEDDGVGGGRVTGIVEDQAGNLWFGTHQGLTKYNPNISSGQTKLFTNYPNSEERFPNDIWSVIIDSKGLFWLGTLKGVFQFDGETYTPFPIPRAKVSDTTSILSYDRVSCILEDRNGTLWFGTDGFGICKYDPSSEAGRDPFSHFTTDDGLCDNNIADLLEDREGNIWIGTMYGGVSRFDGKVFTNFTREGLIQGDETYGLYEDKRGNIWFAAEHHGVYRFDPSAEPAGKQAFTNFHEEEGLNTGGIICFHEDRDGRFWLGGWGGLFRYDESAELSGEKSFFSVTKYGPWK